MNVVLLHDKDAIEPPVDPVLDQVENTLRGFGHNIRRAVTDSDVAPLIAELQAEPTDLVFNLAESFAGRSALESNVAALLNLLDLRYTGSSPSGLLLAGDKSLAKKVLAFHGVRTPQFATVYRGAVDHADDIHFPVIVKPPQEDGSLGISTQSVAKDVKELLDMMGALQAEYQSPVLVEEFIEGREFYIGVLGNANPEALPIIELDFTGFPADRPKIASWESKWGDEGDETGEEYHGTESIFPDNLDDELREQIGRAAIESFQALRLRDYARVDVRINDVGEIYVIEANPNCYLEQKSEFARAAERNGMAYDALIGRIVELALARYAR
jgi:D-alanine-D-alanine ligase